MNKTDVKSMDLHELKTHITEMGLPAFRAGQIYDWLWAKNADSFEEMTNLSLDLRQKLSEEFFIPKLKQEQKLVSKQDGTVKYLYRLSDGECVESVLMRYKHGNSICISTQAGCKMGCRFCASTIAGFVRHLVPSEMMGQITETAKDIGEKISNVVLMGIGEPLDNYENVLTFLKILSSEQGLNLSLRHVSLSTCGLVDKIEKLKNEKLQLTLSVSLHAPNDRIRNQIMPVNAKWNVGALLAACRDYSEATSRRISYEYALIDGVNDSEECAGELARRLKGTLCHVNLIPVNRVKERDFKQSKEDTTERFLKILEQGRITATVRRTLGADINAACGQLRRESREKEGAEN